VLRSIEPPSKRGLMSRTLPRKGISGQDLHCTTVAGESELKRRTVGALAESLKHLPPSALLAVRRVQDLDDCRRHFPAIGGYIGRPFNPPLSIIYIQLRESSAGARTGKELSAHTCREIRGISNKAESRDLPKARLQMSIPQTRPRPWH
jgi:hypothetical protein